MAPKRKRSSQVDVATANERPHVDIPIPPPLAPSKPTALNAPKRTFSKRDAAKLSTNPDVNSQVIDGADAARASPDSDVNEEIAPTAIKQDEGSESPLSDVPEIEPPKKKRVAGPKKVNGGKAEAEADVKTPKKQPQKAKQAPNADSTAAGDPEAEGEEEEANEDEIKEASLRPRPVNSDYLPLPWKGRLGYVGILFRAFPTNYLHSIGLFEYVPSLFKSPSL